MVFYWKKPKIINRKIWRMNRAIKIYEISIGKTGGVDMIDEELE